MYYMIYMYIFMLWAPMLNFCFIISLSSCKLLHLPAAPSSCVVVVVRMVSFLVIFRRNLHLYIVLRVCVCVVCVLFLLVRPLQMEMVTSAFVPI